MSRYVIALVAAFIAVLPAFASAAVVTSQTDSSTASAFVLGNSNTGPFYVQTLGTGLSGSVDHISFSMDFGSLPVFNWQVNLVECPLSSAISCSGQVNAFSGRFTVSGTTSLSYYIANGAGGATAGTGILDPTKYYAISFSEISFENISSRFYGSATSKYANGQCFTYSGGTYTACANVADIAFTLYGSGAGTTTSTTQGIKTIVSPLDGSVTSSATPSFSFTYYVNGAQGSYDHVGFTLQDVTSGVNLDTSGASSTIIASGLSTYSAPFGLQAGHIYVWVPYMSDSTGVNPQLVGPPSRFVAVVAQSLYVSNGGSYISTSSPTTTNGYSTSTSPLTIPSYGATASSTPWGDVMQKKFPFSYFYDLGVVIRELDTGTSTSGVISFVTPTVFGVTPTTSPWVIADLAHLPDQGLIFQIRDFIKYGLWISFGLYAPYAIIRML